MRFVSFSLPIHRHSMLRRTPVMIAGALALGLVLVAVGALPGRASQLPPAEVSSAGIAQTRGEIAQTAEELGRLLFFEQIISGDAQVSCAQCHMPDEAWSDGIPLSAGYTSTLYFRNTPTLLNASQMPVLDWDGRFSGSDMTTLVRDHLTEAHFMNVDGRLMVERLRQVPEYVDSYQAAFDGEVSFGRTLSALAAFVATLKSSDDHPYLRYLAGDSGALPAEERAGLALFEGKAGCASCHSGPLLSDGEPAVMGVPENLEIFSEPLRHITFRRFFRGFGVSEYVALREDPGRYALTFEEDDWGAFRTPSLLEVGSTAPYMHNGTLATLEDVVRFYNSGGGDVPNKDVRLEPLNLTAGEIASLVAFLESLQSDGTPVERPAEPSTYQLRTLGEN